MKKLSILSNIGWQSKLADLIIVIVGITIAFKLNTWNETKKVNAEAADYLTSFLEENANNLNELWSALEYSNSVKKDLDSLSHLLFTGNYDDERIQTFIASMMGLANFSPSVTTMENINSSGEFGLLKESALRKSLIDTYNSYQVTSKLQNLLSDYINSYLTPFLMNKVSFRDFSSLGSDYRRDPLLENIVFGYEVLLIQIITSYNENIDQVVHLNNVLKAASNKI